ncbi:MAG: xanthine dehydrogenase family protein subunit M [Pseudomonadota bacterium]
MYAFAHHRPTSVADAVKAATSSSQGVYLAGGMTLIPTLKQRLADPKDLIDLAALADLREIKPSGGGLSIGAMATHNAVAQDGTIPALSALAEGIGDPQVRNCGTIGGSLANNDPAADYPAAVLALNAQIKTDQRTIASDDYFQGLFTTALAPGELIVRVDVPKPDSANYQKFANPASRYALVGVMVARTGGDVRVAVTGAGSDGVFRFTAAEQALASDFSPGAVPEVDAGMMSSDIHAASDYRAHLVKILTQRAVAES